jgi:membrane-bound lytic murein transglycosylase A
MTKNQLSPTVFNELVGWYEDDHLQAFKAFLTTARHMLKAPYPTKKFEVDSEALLRIAEYAISLDIQTPKDARIFFEKYFVPHIITPESETCGFVTGYYEPEIRASLTKTDKFSIPLYKRPADLISLNNDNRPSDMDPSFIFGRKTDNGIETYPDRAAINGGFLEGKELELVYLESYVEVFFIHIQGSARLLLNDNGNVVMRVKYSGKTGHPFTAIGRILLEWEELTPENVSMQSIKQWLHEHPDEAMDLMELNQSYIFFQEVLDIDPTQGPVGAADVPLTPRRSMAVDKEWHTYGMPIWISINQPLYSEKRNFNQLMIAQDTGSAIVGEARGDLFIGCSKGAGEIAGHIKHNADFFLLLPRF